MSGRDRRDELERRLLGEVFCNHHVLALAAVAQLSPAHFADPLHAAVWRAMRAQYDRGEVVSVHGVEAELDAEAARALAGRTKRGTVRAALAELVRIGTGNAPNAEAAALALVALAERPAGPVITERPAPSPGPASADLEAIGAWLDAEIAAARAMLQRHALRLAGDPVVAMRESFDALRAAAQLTTCIKASACLHRRGLPALVTLATELVIALAATPPLVAHPLDDAFERFALATWARLLHVATKPGPPRAESSEAPNAPPSSPQQPEGDPP